MGKSTLVSPKIYSLEENNTSPRFAHTDMRTHKCKKIEIPTRMGSDETWWSIALYQNSTSVKNTELSIMIVLIMDIIKVEFLINAKRRNQK